MVLVPPFISKRLGEVSAKNCGNFGVYKLGIGREEWGQAFGGLKREGPRREPEEGQLPLFSPRRAGEMARHRTDS